MKCPQCNHDFALTLGRYLKAPFGRMPCPSCHAKLVGKHRWFYWPLIILGVVLGPFSLMYAFSAYYGMAGALFGWIAGAVVIVGPFDIFLESRFSVLTLREDKGLKDRTEGDG